ncbi:MAG: YbaB/EbfC family nucleoid-associated protein [Campylobacteraceae bacterium]|jgi:DNA-binding YbaB/EbfC family protein|nr:YbaB/EbfC family nucleoid-associated protein [Campylobacteraceae bacterium]
MFEGIDFSKMGAMLEEAQRKAKEIEEGNKNKTFIAKSGGGLLSVSANGEGEIIDVTIDDSLLSDKDAMQILLISAINDCFKMVEENKKLVASQMFGGFGSLDGFR